MKRFDLMLRWAAVAICLALLPGTAQAQDIYTYTVGVYGGIGGSFDADPDPGLSRPTYQLSFSMLTEARTLFGIRVGQLDFGNHESLGRLFDSDLTYVTLAGEYRLRRPLYDSGLFLGLGGYRLEGTRIDGRSSDETALGVTFGVTGDFPINQRFSILVELSGHYADFDDAQFFGLGHVGFAVHF